MNKIIIKHDISLRSKGQIYKCNNPIFKDQQVLYIPIKEISIITSKSYDFLRNEIKNCLGYYVFDYVKTVKNEKAFRIAEIDNKYQFYEVMNREKGSPIGLLFSQMILMDFDELEFLLKVSPVLDLENPKTTETGENIYPIKTMLLGGYDNATI